jgi:hypothetical protein
VTAVAVVVAQPPRSVGRAATEPHPVVEEAAEAAQAAATKVEAVEAVPAEK